MEQADRYYNLIFDEINYICKNINAGKSMEHVRKGYRATKVKSHLIFYRVLNDTIEVIRILHEQMDIESRLNDWAAMHMGFQLSGIESGGRTIEFRNIKGKQTYSIQFRALKLKQTSYAQQKI